MGRREVRENVFKLIYELVETDDVSKLSLSRASLTQDDLTEDYDETENVFNLIDKDGQKYLKKVYNGILAERTNIERIIDQYARAFNLDRIYKVDTAILLIAIYEILHMKDIPYKVSVNEAIELAKAYSTEKSASYINGILASVIKNMEDNK